MRLPYNTLMTDRPSEGGCVHEGDDFAIGWRTFRSGELFPAHLHEHFEEVFIGMSGSLIVVIDDVEHVLGAGDRIVAERRHVHSLRNDGNESAQICYLKVPFIDGDTVWVDAAPTP